MKDMKKKIRLLYERLDSIDKHNATSVPPKEQLYSKLKQKGITDEEYERASKNLKDTGCKRMADSLLVHLKTHLLLETDAFEKFRDQCKQF